MVLSMVYTLWVGVRLADAIAWQEPWAHPAAFGFRPSTSALDGAVVTQVILELCGLREWAVAGIKCRLHRMFRSHRPGGRVIAGAFGLWWQPTSGILHACPLSVILANVLTTIWNWAVDYLRRQGVAWKAATTLGFPPCISAR